VVRELEAEYESAIQVGEAHDADFRARAPEIRAQLKAAFDGQTVEQQTAIWHQVIPDESGLDVISTLMSFNWVLARAPADSLLTCDNPVYFHVHEGLVAPNSEMTLTLSPSTALWATREPIEDGSQMRASNAFVRELNRRIAHNSTRWVMSSLNHPWILPFLQKGSWALNRVRGPRP